MHVTGRVNPSVSSVPLIESSQSICPAYQSTGFSMIESLTLIELRTLTWKQDIQKTVKYTRKA